MNNEVEKPINVALLTDERARVRDALATRKAVLVRQMNAEPNVTVKEIRRSQIDRIDVLSLKFV